VMLPLLGSGHVCPTPSGDELRGIPVGTVWICRYCLTPWLAKYDFDAWGPYPYWVKVRWYHRKARRLIIDAARSL
jgi:hypothetical protein